MPFVIVVPFMKQFMTNFGVMIQQLLLQLNFLMVQYRRFEI